MLVLAVADAHVPDRAIEIPAQFRQLLVPGKIGQVLALGNVADKKTAALLNAVSSNRKSVRGDMDIDPQLPLLDSVQIEGLKVGLVSGLSVIPHNDPDALLIAARQLDADIVLWGGSHELETFELENKFFLNPGSLTGAQSLEHTETTPSFCLLDIKGSACVVYIYSLVNDQLKVEKVAYKKD